jgi:hypothetical protein
VRMHFETIDLDERVMKLYRTGPFIIVNQRNSIADTLAIFRRSGFGTVVPYDGTKLPR